METSFHLLHTDMEPPATMNDPFNYQPHPLCVMAADYVRTYIKEVEEWQADLAAGKMFGVLVCRRDNGQMGFLAAYSGLLGGRNDWSYFVPPVFDAQQPDGHFKTTERAISAINAEVLRLSADATQVDRVSALKQQRREMSEDLQLWLFRQYRVLNPQGEVRDLVDLWRDYHASEKVRRRFPLPPGGTGDCCAPKLLQHAYLHRLQPLCMAEFWQGASPKGEIRHHGQFYPACSGKCKPVLHWMLPPSGDGQASEQAFRLDIIHEESSFVVVNKPAGLLSVPGRSSLPSVESMLRQRYNGAEGPFMVHRLDMDTSGVMVVARNIVAYRHLQRQFAEHTTRKRYVALLQSPSPRTVALLTEAPRGTISLPLRPDMLDRPRQVVDPAHGKQAVTHYEVLSLQGPNPRIALMPLTGRTHQLRVHCAHPQGLDCPILGDPLYGYTLSSSSSSPLRLHLHAEQLSLLHPDTLAPLTFQAPPPF